MDFGSKAADFGHLVVSPSARIELLARHPEIGDLIRPFIGSVEFLNGKQRYCLWLKDVPPERFRGIPEIMARIAKVREERLKSKDANTRRWADRPYLFQADRQPEHDYLLVPKVSSERRRYIPLGFMSSDYITNPSVLVIPDAQLFHFAVLQSQMHMAWTRYTCGRMKSDYQYSNTVVYNNFPWPSVNEKQTQELEVLAQRILDARARYPDSTLAALYDPLAPRIDLLDAHVALDRAVDKLYLPNGFETDADRVVFLFKRYQELTVIKDR